jgi:hypothetical protein
MNSWKPSLVNWKRLRTNAELTFNLSCLTLDASGKSARLLDLYNRLDLPQIGERSYSGQLDLRT